MYNTLFLIESRAIYEIMWKNTVQPDRPPTAIWRMRIACKITKGTNTYNIASPMQQQKSRGADKYLDRPGRKEASTTTL
jgi:hypothetical protein